MYFDNQALPLLTTVKGMNNFVRTKIARPEVLTRGQLRKLSAAARDEHDRSRLRWTNGGLTINTPQLVTAVHEAEKIVLSNSGKNSGARGLLLNGESTMGKTTTLEAIVQRIASHYRKYNPAYIEEGLIPIMFIDVPPDATPKSMLREVCRFLGLPFVSHQTLDQMAHMVTDVLRSVDIQLVIVDEIHNLARNTPGNGGSADVLKMLSNQTGATFVYAGINVDRNGLLAGDRGRQIAGRFVRKEMAPFSRANEGDRADWNAVLTTFESGLPLADLPKGTLTSISDYLFERTAGSIGTLSYLLRQATIDAIRGSAQDGQPEVITRPLLDEITVDSAAEAWRSTAAIPDHKVGSKPSRARRSA